MHIHPLAFLQTLWTEINDDNIFNGAAALAYYLMLAIFPAAISLLSILPFLPMPDLQPAILTFIGQVLPADAASLFRRVLNEVLEARSGGLLSFGLLFTLWAASSGLYAIMQQLNMTYDIRETRPYWKARLIALGLSLLFLVLVVGAFALVVAGSVLENWLSQRLGHQSMWLVVFAAVRWFVIIGALLLGFSLIYFFGPDVEQRFIFLTPGSAAGVSVLIGGSVLFRVYVSNFGDYAASYGSLGAVIVLLLWLYLAGLVLLLGSEINALSEHFAPEGKSKGERHQPKAPPTLGPT